MLISLHKQATTTPKIRAAIQASTEPAWMVAERYGISEQTVWKWRKRDSVHDRSHTAHRLQSTLTPAQEAVAVSLRKTRDYPIFCVRGRFSSLGDEPLAEHDGELGLGLGPFAGRAFPVLSRAIESQI